MAPGTKTLVLSVVLLLCATPARAADPMPQATVVDARRALPLVPALSWKDGFFLEHSDVPDLGLHPRVTMIYNRDPLGSDAALHDRIMLQPSAVLSIVKYVDVGLALPIALWQDDSGFNVTRSALGDLRLSPKLRLPIPDPFPHVAVSLAVGFPTGNTGARLSAGQVSFFPRLVVDWVTLKKRLLIAANIGGFLAGTGGTCDPNTQPLDPTDPAKMRRLPCPMACDPMQQPLDPADPTGMKRLPCPAMSTDQLSTLSTVVQGLGNHFFYGIGFTANLSPEIGLQLHTELIGSFSSTNQSSRTPLFWDVGVTRSIANKWNFGAMYGLGLTEGSPGHTVMVQLGYAWVHKDPEPEKVPKIGVEVQVNMGTPMMPPGAGAPGALPPGVAPAGAAPGGAAPGGAAPGGAAPGGAAPGGAAPGGPAPGGPAQQAPAGGPAQQPPPGGAAQVPTIQISPPKPKTVEVELPSDWWPKDDKDKKK